MGDHALRVPPVSSVVLVLQLKIVDRLAYVFNKAYSVGFLFFFEGSSEAERPENPRALARNLSRSILRSSGVFSTRDSINIGWVPPGSQEKKPGECWFQGSNSKKPKRGLKLFGVASKLRSLSTPSVNLFPLLSNLSARIITERESMNNDRYNEKTAQRRVRGLDDYNPLIFAFSFSCATRLA